MEETFIISIYQKIELNDNILAFKRVGIAKNAKIKMDDDFSEAVFYDEDKKQMQYREINDGRVSEFSINDVKIYFLQKKVNRNDKETSTK